MSVDPHKEWHEFVLHVYRLINRMLRDSVQVRCTDRVYCGWQGPLGNYLAYAANFSPAVPYCPVCADEVVFWGVDNTTLNLPPDERLILLDPLPL